MNSNKVHVLKLSDIRGWSMLCEDAGKTRVGAVDFVRKASVAKTLKFFKVILF